MHEQLVKHLQETPKEQLDAEYAELEEYNKCGPTVNEYFADNFLAVARENAVMREGIKLMEQMRLAELGLIICADPVDHERLAEEFSIAKDNAYAWLEKYASYLYCK